MLSCASACLVCAIPFNPSIIKWLLAKTFLSSTSIALACLYSQRCKGRADWTDLQIELQPALHAIVVLQEPQLSFLPTAL
jgi:hypothetical protein